MCLWAENLRSIRKASNLTQEDLSEKSGISRASIIKYENATAEPSMRVFERLAYALDVPYQLFFADPRLVRQYLNGSAHEFQDRYIEFISFDSAGSRKYDLIAAFDKLNEIGQIEAIKRVEELAEIMRYIKRDDEQED